jgi:hypothetical protein
VLCQIGVVQIVSVNEIGGQLIVVLPFFVRLVVKIKNIQTSESRFLEPSTIATDQKT